MNFALIVLAALPLVSSAADAEKGLERQQNKLKQFQQQAAKVMKDGHPHWWVIEPIANWARVKGNWTETMTKEGEVSSDLYSMYTDISREDKAFNSELASTAKRERGRLDGATQSTIKNQEILEDMQTKNRKAYDDNEQMITDQLEEIAKNTMPNPASGAVPSTGTAPGSGTMGKALVDAYNTEKDSENNMELMEDQQRYIDKLDEKSQDRTSMNQDYNVEAIKEGNDALKNEGRNIKKELKSEDRDENKETTYGVKEITKASEKELDVQDKIMDELGDTTQEVVDDSAELAEDAKAGKVKQAAKNQKIIEDANEKFADEEKNAKGKFDDQLDDAMSKIGKASDQAGKKEGEVLENSAEGIVDRVDYVADGSDTAFVGLADTDGLSEDLDGSVEETENVQLTAAKALEKSATDATTQFVAAAKDTSSLLGSPLAITPSLSDDGTGQFASSSQNLVIEAGSAADKLMTDAAKQRKDELESLAKDETTIAGVEAKAKAAMIEKETITTDTSKLQAQEESELNDFDGKRKDGESQLETQSDQMFTKNRDAVAEDEEQLPGIKDKGEEDLEELEQEVQEPLKGMKDKTAQSIREWSAYADSAIKKRQSWSTIADNAMDDAKDITTHIERFEKDIQDSTDDTVNQAEIDKGKAEKSTKEVVALAKNIPDSVGRAWNVINAGIASSADAMTTELKKNIDTTRDESTSVLEHALYKADKFHHAIQNKFGGLQKEFHEAIADVPNMKGSMEDIERKLNSGLPGLKEVHLSTFQDKLATAVATEKQQLSAESQKVQSNLQGTSDEWAGKLVAAEKGALASTAKAAGASSEDSEKIGKMVGGLLGGLSAEQLDMEGGIEAMSSEAQLRTLALAQKMRLMDGNMQELTEMSQHDRVTLLTNLRNQFGGMEGLVGNIAQQMQIRVAPALQHMTAAADGKINGALGSARTTVEEHARDLGHQENLLLSMLTGVGGEEESANEKLAATTSEADSAIATALGAIDRVKGDGMNGGDLVHLAGTQDVEDTNAQKVLMDMFHTMKGKFDEMSNKDFPDMLHTASTEAEEEHQELRTKMSQGRSKTLSDIEVFQSELKGTVGSFDSSMSEVESNWEGLKREWTEMENKYHTEVAKHESNLKALGPEQADDLAELRSERNSLVQKMVKAIAGLFQTAFEGLEVTKKEAKDSLAKVKGQLDRTSAATQTEVVQALSRLRDTDVKVKGVAKRMSQLRDWSDNYSTNEAGWRDEIMNAFKTLSLDFDLDTSEMENAMANLGDVAKADAAQQQHEAVQEVSEAIKTTNSDVAVTKQHMEDEFKQAQEAEQTKNAIANAALAAAAQEGESQLGGAGFQSGSLANNADSLGKAIETAMAKGNTAGDAVDIILTDKKAAIDQSQTEQRDDLRKMGESSLLQGAERLDREGVMNLIHEGYSEQEVHSLLSQRHHALVENLRKVRPSD